MCWLYPLNLTQVPPHPPHRQLNSSYFFCLSLEGSLSLWHFQLPFCYSVVPFCRHTDQNSTPDMRCGCTKRLHHSKITPFIPSLMNTVAFLVAAAWWRFPFHPEKRHYTRYFTSDYSCGFQSLRQPFLQPCSSFISWQKSAENPNILHPLQPLSFHRTSWGWRRRISVFGSHTASFPAANIHPRVPCFWFFPS